MRRFGIFESLCLLLVAIIIILIVRPTIRAHRIGRNEQEAIRLLQAIRNAQDTHRESTGRYAYLSDLLHEPATSQSPLNSVNVIIWPGGLFELGGSGYLFTVYLPASNSQGVRESSETPPSPELSQQYWSVYAWPKEFGVSGQRTFFMNFDGHIYHTENLGNPYEGAYSVPDWMAVIRDASQGMGGEPVSEETHGFDEKIWDKLESDRSESDQQAATPVKFEIP